MPIRFFRSTTVQTSVLLSCKLSATPELPCYRTLSLTSVSRTLSPTPGLHTSVTVDGTRENSIISGATSSDTKWPISEPYFPSGMLKLTSFKDVLQLPHDALDTHMTELPVAEVQRGGLAAAALPYPTAYNVTQKTHSDVGVGDQFVATEGPPKCESVSSQSDPSKDMFSASMSGSTNQEGGKSLYSSKFHDSLGFLPTEPEHSESKTLTQHSKAKEAGNSMDSRNDITKLSSLHTRLPHGAAKKESRKTTDHEGPISSPTLVYPSTEIGTRTMSSSFTITTSSHESYNAAVDNSNISRRLSPQGVELILSSVIGGSLAFIAIVLLHRLVLRYFHKHKQGSSIDRSSLPMDDSFDKKLAVENPEVAEISHFSMSP